MRYIVTDLEWNGAYSRRAHGYFNEIIEIGAVALDDRLQITDRFQAIVRPSVSKKLSGIVSELTNITGEELADGTDFDAAVRAFSAFIGDGDTAVLTWSTTDLLVLIENCRFFYGRERIPFLRNYLDLQAYAQRRMDAAAGQQLGLARAGELLGIPEDALSLHRAPDDSLLTARILQKVGDPASLAAAVEAADGEFYRRATFKVTVIDDIDSPLVRRSELHFTCPADGRTLQPVGGRDGKWHFRNRAFCARLTCPSCEKIYNARAQFKLRYEGVECRKKLTERVPPAEGEPSPDGEPSVQA